MLNYPSRRSFSLIRISPKCFPKSLFATIQRWQVTFKVSMAFCCLWSPVPFSFHHPQPWQQTGCTDDCPEHYLTSKPAAWARPWISLEGCWERSVLQSCFHNSNSNSKNDCHCWLSVWGCSAFCLHTPSQYLELLALVWSELGHTNAARTLL